MHAYICLRKTYHRTLKELMKFEHLIGVFGLTVQPSLRSCRVDHLVKLLHCLYYYKTSNFVGISKSVRCNLYFLISVHVSK